MKAILAIARAEIVKNWKIIAVPLFAVIGVLVLAALGTKVSDRDSRGSLMQILILFGAPLAAVPAAVLGLNLFGPDIRQRKLSFFLTRPCAPSQLWLGRLFGAAFLVSFGWVAAVTLPHLVDSNGFTSGSGMSMSAEAFLAAAGLAGVFLALNSISMVLAANSPRWFVADAVAAMVLFAGAAWSLEHALRLGDLPLVGDNVMAILLGAMVALFLGGLAFIAAGHGGGPAGHRAHSLTWWSVGLLVLAGLSAQREYEWNRSLGSMLSYANAKSVGPTQVLVSTFFPGRGGFSFLLDTGTGRSRRVNGQMNFRATHQRGSDLIGFFELRFHFGGGRLLSDQLVISSLDTVRRPAVELPARSSWEDLLDISKSGDLAVFSTDDGLSIVRTQTGATVFDAPGRKVRWAQFETPSTVITLDSDQSAPRLRILGLDGKVIEERAFPVTAAEWSVTVHANSGRVALTQPLIGVALYERDGRVVASMPTNELVGRGFRGTASVSLSSVLMTRAGDCLVLGGSGLKLIRHGESAVRDMPFQLEGAPIALGGSLEIMGELESGDVMINQYELAQKSILVVDPLTGVIRLRLKGFKTPAFRAPRAGVVRAGEPTDDSALRLLSSDDHDLFFLDPGSTTPRLLVKNTREDR